MDRPGEGPAREQPRAGVRRPVERHGELVTDTTLKDSPADYVGDYTARGRIINVGITTSFAFDAKGDAK